MNPLKTLSSAKESLSNEENLIDLKALDLEFEFRTSSLVDKLCQGHLPSCICKITFDEGNILDLQNSGEIEADAMLAMEVVSSDKRALKTRLK